MKNNKAQIMNVIYLTAILFTILFLGLLLVFGGMIIGWVFDEAVPELSTLGVVGSSNLTEISQYTLTPVNNIVQSFTWLTGVIYLMALIGCIGFSVVFRVTGNKWLIAFFMSCMLLLVITSIFISNIYEEFFNDGTEVGAMLHEHALISWLILYSPLVICVIGFICGIIMFTGEFSEEGYA